MINNRYLTKSHFKLAVECPTKLFYAGKHSEYYDSMMENDFLAMLAEGGYQVGELAKQIYPSGVEISGLIHDAAIEKTRNLLQHENIVLFEPAICFGDFFIRIDILIKRGGLFELVDRSKSKII